MCLSEVMMRQYQERKYELGDPNVAQLTIGTDESGVLTWNEVVERVTKARRKQKNGAGVDDGVSIIRREIEKCA